MYCATSVGQPVGRRYVSLSRENTSCALSLSRFRHLGHDYLSTYEGSAITQLVVTNVPISPLKIRRRAFRCCTPSPQQPGATAHNSDSVSSSKKNVAGKLVRSTGLRKDVGIRLGSAGPVTSQPNRPKLSDNKENTKAAMSVSRSPFADSGVMSGRVVPGELYLFMYIFTTKKQLG